MPFRVLLTMVLVFVALAIETAHSTRNARRLRRRGAVEPPGDPYMLMAVTYPSAFVLMGLEGVWWATPLDVWFLAGILVWLVSKSIKYSAIRSLGDRWSFRVLVMSGVPLVSTGLYRFLRHPNYVGVIGELVATALLCPAPITGVLSIVGFSGILRRRLRVEERALGLRA